MAKSASFDLSKESIFKVCDKLQTENIKVTTENVRNELGGGSFGMILPLIKEWKTQAGNKKSITDIQIPDEALNAVRDATTLIWKIATEHQAETIQAVRAECQKIEQEAFTERDEALNEINRMEVELKKQEELIEKLIMEKEEQLKNCNRLELQIQKQQLALDAGNEKIEESKKAMHDALEKEKLAIERAALLQGELNAIKPIQRKSPAKQT